MKRDLVYEHYCTEVYNINSCEHLIIQIYIRALLNDSEFSDVAAIRLVIVGLYPLLMICKYKCSISFEVCSFQIILSLN